MITYKDYLSALEVCKNYLEQEKNKIKDFDFGIYELKSKKDLIKWNKVAKGDKIILTKIGASISAKIKINDIVKVMSVERRGFSLAVRIKHKNQYSMKCSILDGVVSSSWDFEFL